MDNLNPEENNNINNDINSNTIINNENTLANPEPMVNNTNINPEPIVNNQNINNNQNNEVPNVNPFNTESTTPTTIYPIEPKKKKGKIWIIIITIIVLLLAGIFLYYKFVLCSPKHVFKTFFNETYAKTNLLIKNIENNTFDLDLSKEVVLLENNTTLKGNLGDTDLSEMNLGFKIQMDSKNKKVYMQSTLGEKQKDILSAYAIFENNLAVIKSDILPSTIKETYELKEQTTESLEKIDTTKSVNNALIIYKAINTSLINNMKDGFTSMSATINNVKVNKYTYTLDNKNTKELYKNILNDLLKDNEALTAFKEISNNDNIKDEINKLITSIDNNTYETRILNIYTSLITNDFIGFDFANDKTSLKYISLNNEITLSIKNDNEEVVFKGKKENGIITGTITAGAYNIKIKITKLEYNDLDLVLSINDTNVNIKYQNKKENDLVLTSSLDLNIKSKEMDVTFANQTKLTKNGTINIPVISDTEVVPYNTYTDEMKDQILANASNALTGSIYEKIINGFNELQIAESNQESH